MAGTQSWAKKWQLMVGLIAVLAVGIIAGFAGAEFSLAARTPDVAVAWGDEEWEEGSQYFEGEESFDGVLNEDEWEYAEVIVEQRTVVLERTVWMVPADLPTEFARFGVEPWTVAAVAERVIADSAPLDHVDPPTSLLGLGGPMSPPPAPGGMFSPFRSDPRRP